MARIRAIDDGRRKSPVTGGLFAVLALAIIAGLVVLSSMDSGGSADGSGGGGGATGVGEDAGGERRDGSGGAGSSVPASGAEGRELDAGDAGSSADGQAGDGAPANGRPMVFEVTIGGERFELDTALSPAERTLGLSFRDEIAVDGGMVFAFRRKGYRAFVMRDCLVPIDILYCEDDGTVINTHAMEVDPRRAGETDRAYEMRLRRYTSAEPTRLVVELKGGTVKRLGVEPGDRVEGDFARLFRHAQAEPVYRR
jgi:hypothetical protein